MADNPYAGDITSSAKITTNLYAAEIDGTEAIAERGAQVALAANPVTQGPVPSVTDSSLGTRSEIRGVPPMFEHDGPVPSVTDTSTADSRVSVPGGIIPGSMRPPSTVDTSRNR
jgi:hypothetical protein